MSALLVIKAEQGFPLSIEADAIQLKNLAIQTLQEVVAVDPASLGKAATLMSNAAGVIKRMEASRVEVKAPVLDLERRIDKMAKDFSAPIQSELDRVKRLVSDCHAKEASRIAEENRKREEEERKVREAAEKIRREEAAIAEAKYQAEQKAIREVAEAEQRKLAEELKKTEALAKAAAKKKDDGLRALREAAAQEERERIATAQEVARIESERQMAIAEAERARVAAQQEADRISEASKVSVPVVQAKAEGVSSRKVWKYNCHSPSIAYASHPEFFTLVESKAAINFAIAAGLRKCDGIEIFEEVETKVRAS